MTDKFDTPQELFAYAVFRVIDTFFAGTFHQQVSNGRDADFLTFDNGIYAFNFKTTQPNLSGMVSDSLHELVEIAIRVVEKEITSRLVPGGAPYTTVKVMLQTDEDFASCFSVLDRPSRVEMYTDTFRKGIAQLRVIYGV